MRIGFISIVGERGQWHVTKNFMRALQDEHELFLLARPFAVRDGVFLGNIEDYSLKTETKYSPTYQLSPEIVENWVENNKLDVVFYNEEYDWRLVEAAIVKGAKVVTYLDYFTAADIPKFRIYDKIIACAKHAYDEFVSAEAKNIVFFNWGVDDALFRSSEGTKKSTFFHSAGWGGINWRKCTPDVLRVFDGLRSEKFPFTLFLHSQTAKKNYPLDCQEILDRRVADGSLEVYFGSIPHPGLYDKGHINIAPSILEGLGLFLYEGLSCGMPTITTDAPPMNQPVKHGKNGLLVKTTGSHFRKDPYFFPEYDIDVNSLKDAMVSIGSNPKGALEMAAEARRGILEDYSYKSFAFDVKRLFEELSHEERV